MAEVCPESWTADEIVTATSSGIGVLSIIIIGCISIRKQMAGKYEINVILEILYYISIITSCIILTGSIVSIIICKAHSRRVSRTILAIAVDGGYGITCSSLSGTLIIRLYITFRDSRWSISKRKVVYSLLILLVVDMAVVGTAIAWCTEWMELEILYVVDFIALIIYILVSIWAICRFSSNLLSIAKIRAATKLELQLQPVLSDKPQKMINCSSKFMALFILASSTTFITFLVSTSFIFVVGIHPGTLWSIDCVVNTICLYLCHNFAALHYAQYCNELDRCCRWKMSSKVKRDFISRKQAISATRNDDVVETVSGDGAADCNCGDCTTN